MDTHTPRVTEPVGSRSAAQELSSCPDDPEGRDGGGGAHEGGGMCIIVTDSSPRTAEASIVKQSSSN